jgi:hypothetical protein
MSAFESWCVFEHTIQADDEAPLLAIRYDKAAGEIHVTRSIRCRAWATEAQGQTIVASESIRRIRELVGTIRLAENLTESEITSEIAALLFHAVVGTSRLPLTSLEAPLPAYTFGQVAYCFQSMDASASDQSIDTWTTRRLRDRVPRAITSRLLEFSIRATSASEIPNLAAAWGQRWSQSGRSGAELAELLRE